MKRLITLLVLLLAGPPLASAQQFFGATSGDMRVDLFSTSADFVVAGPLFSMSGDINFVYRNPLDTGGGWAVGTDFSGQIYADTNFNLDLNVGVEDVYFASVTFDPDGFTIPGPGTYKTPFTFESDVRSSSEGDFIFFGQGIVTVDIVPSKLPGVVDILSADYTFTNHSHVPEPSTTSLLLLGLAGLAVIGRRRGPSTT